MSLNILFPSFVNEKSELLSLIFSNLTIKQQLQNRQVNKIWKNFIEMDYQNHLLISSELNQNNIFVLLDIYKRNKVRNPDNFKLKQLRNRIDKLTKVLGWLKEIDSSNEKLIPDAALFYKIGCMFEKGEVPLAQSQVAARTYYQRGASLGNIESIEKLEKQETSKIEKNKLSEVLKKLYSAHVSLNMCLDSEKAWELGKMFENGQYPFIKSIPLAFHYYTLGFQSKYYKSYASAAELLCNYRCDFDLDNEIIDNKINDFQILATSYAPDSSTERSNTSKPKMIGRFKRVIKNIIPRSSRPVNDKETKIKRQTYPAPNTKKYHD